MPRVSVGSSSVEAPPGQSVLESLLRAGVWMPSSCNQGTCGTCKVTVLSGSVDHRDSPLETLPAEQRDAGLALACQSHPTCDVEVTPAGPTSARAGEARTHPLRDLTATITGIEDVARDTRKVLLALPEPLAFSAGQCVELEVPRTGERRQFSLANTATEDRVLELHVRLVEGGAATERWLFADAACGDEVRVTGPLGDFRAPEPEADDGGPMVLLGGGTGLAPLLGIVRTALERHPDREAVLYHGVRHAADLYDRERLVDLENRFAGFRFVPVLSREETRAYRTGYVTEAFLADVSSARGWTGWLCGSPALFESGAAAFKRRRMAPRLIHREKFTAAPATSSLTSPLTSTGA
ncbi:2Fe-2S iron-sulfur cluster-binding protein [Nocardioides bruguierae]|uniref:2Fe-2S iron-sulfur cluster-binding protein n=1 Tax=Nocardioides bruguierae TaxID=2945102 RepID=A0A9X2IFL8_9ACTN|nr:2Fe-2S iron-sulfur cluster-binding protein [Nocardioides bruguierae]MCM0621203.1 2Fe-2S iron-sulfur cluster-binding protein [Nocardioides bruguierae]